MRTVTPDSSTTFVMASISASSSWEEALLRDVVKFLGDISNETSGGLDPGQAREHALERIMLRVLDAAREAAIDRAAPSTDNASILALSQQHILTLLHAGLRPAAIADQLSISLATVRSHIRDACQRLGVSGARAAMRRAQQLGLLSSS